jgi:hypothetical protein
MWIALSWTVLVADAEPAADPTVLWIYAPDRSVTDPFAGKAPPESVQISKMTVRVPGRPEWVGAAARVVKVGRENLDLARERARPWFAALPRAPDQLWAFDMPMARGPSGGEWLEVHLLRGPPVEIHASDIATVTLEYDAVSITWSAAGKARVPAATAAFVGNEAVYVVGGDQVVWAGGFGDRIDPHGSFSLGTTWGDDGFGRRVVEALKP